MQAEPGDILIVSHDCRRKWWQFWKPERWIEQRRYRVISRYYGIGNSIMTAEPLLTGENVEPTRRRPNGMEGNKP